MSTNSNAIVPFATGSNPNVISSAAYAALAARQTGFQSGLAQSAEVNEAVRQPAFVATVLAQFIADYGNANVNDDGNIAALESNLIAALFGLISPKININNFANVVGTAPGGAKTASWTIEELSASVSLGGVCYDGVNLSLSFNGAGNGANGMDTGSIPANGDLSIYAIYNPTSGVWATLGCSGSSSNGSVYSGGNMPTGFTASRLIWTGVTGSSNIPKFYQVGRKIFLGAVLITGSAAATSFTSLSISSAVPANATYVGGPCGITGSGALTLYLAGDASETGVQWCGATVTASSSNSNYGDLPMITRQTIYYKVGGGNGSIWVSNYTF